MELLGYFLALFVGLSLGLIGGGGSILAMPVLVYIFNFTPQLSTSYSLFIVGISSLIAAVKQYRLKNLNLKIAVAFGAPSIASLLIVRSYFLPKIPDIIFSSPQFIVTKNSLLMLVFAVLMVLASVSMIKNQDQAAHSAEAGNFQLAVVGFMAGIVTGFLGAGGGFLIIPALVFFAALPMKKAIGTSLLIISVNAIIGFAGDLFAHVQLDFHFLLMFTAMAIVGIFIGTSLSKKMDGNKLKPLFGWFVLIAGFYIIIKEIFFK